MRNHNTNPALKILYMFLGFTTFIIGLNLASRFSFGFGSKYITLAIVFLVAAYFVYRFKKNGCCGGG